MNNKEYIKGFIKVALQYTTLYHGTSVENIKNILRQGLKPTINSSLSKIMQTINLKATTPKFVHVATNRSLAEIFANNFSTKYNGKVLTIKMPTDEFKLKAKPDTHHPLGEAYMFKKISPKYISLDTSK